jgi:hypothetical protein
VDLYCKAIWREERTRARDRIAEARIAAADQKSYDAAVRQLSAPPAEA